MEEFYNVDVLDNIESEIDELDGPKRLSKEWLRYGKLAEWMAVNQGRSLKEIEKSEQVNVNYNTLVKWSSLHNWQQKRSEFLTKPTTIETLVYDLLFAHLIEANNTIQEDYGKTTLTLDEITALEKLLKMYKYAGIPFYEKVGSVMKVFVRYVENIVHNQEHVSIIADVIRSFISDVQAGIINPPE